MCSITGKAVQPPTTTQELRLRGNGEANLQLLPVTMGSCEPGWRARARGGAKVTFLGVFCFPPTPSKWLFSILFFLEGG